MVKRHALSVLLSLAIAPLGLAEPGLAPALRNPAVGHVDFSFFWLLSPSVVTIAAQNRRGGVSVGSGVMVGEGLVVTNCHVTRDATGIQVVKQALRWTVHAQASDLEHDLCLLHAPHMTGQIAPISRKQPHVGQPVIAIGYVGGVAPQMSGGEVRALYRFDGGTVIQSTASFNSGASGGGLFDRDGKLLGIVAFRHQGGEGYHFALPVDWIYRRSLDLRRAREVEPLGRALPFWQEAGDRQPYFLKAAALEASRDWTALREFAEKWTAVEQGNPDAWLALGLAHERTGDFEQAIASYSSAVRSDLEYAQAWYSLGLVYIARGQREQLQEVQRVLMTLNEELARKLNERARE